MEWQGLRTWYRVVGLRHRRWQALPATGRSRGRVVTHSLTRAAPTPHRGQTRAR